MSRTLLIGKQSKENEGLCSSLTSKGFTCFLAQDDDRISEQLSKNLPDIVIIDNNQPDRMLEIASQIKQARNSPVIAILEAGMLAHGDDFASRIDDFVIRPFQTGELEIRIKRLLGMKRQDEGEQIKLGDLVIDTAKCEVSVGGRPVLLTFKEYQLLKFLAGNQGRVFSRDALLNKVWGYEYYGGDRTVDVHIKRLRSKIEDVNHSFIETVRNIGYRLKVD